MLSTERFTKIDACNSFHITNDLLQKLRHLVLFFVPLFLMGMSTYIPYVIIHYVKKPPNKSIAPAGAILVTCSACSRKLLLKKTVIDIKIDINQNGKVTAVTVFPPEITNIFVEETLREAKGNFDQLLEKFLLLENHGFYSGIYSALLTFIQDICFVYTFEIGDWYFAQVIVADLILYGDQFSWRSILMDFTILWQIRKTLSYSSIHRSKST